MAISPVVKDLLKRYGLESLTTWASDAIINGWTEEQITLELYQRPEFKTRFPAIFALEDQGAPPISVEEYLSYEKTVHALANMWGMELEKSEVDAMIAGRISAIEAERRFDLAAAAVFETDTETRSELERLFGVGIGQQMKYWMNPNAELGKLQQQYRIAEVAGAAIRTGYGQITAEQALRLTEAGIDRARALTGFAELSKMEELFAPIDIGETTIDESQQIELLAGNADIREQVEQRINKRQAEFEGGGGYALSEQGFATGAAE